MRAMIGLVLFRISSAIVAINQGLAAGWIAYDSEEEFRTIVVHSSDSGGGGSGERVDVD